MPDIPDDLQLVSDPRVVRGSTFGWQDGPGTDPRDNGEFAYGGSSLNNPEDYAALPPNAGVPPGYKFPVLNPQTGDVVWVTHRDKGPAAWTGRGVDLAPSAMNKLHAQTDQPLVVDTAHAIPGDLQPVVGSSIPNDLQLVSQPDSLIPTAPTTLVSPEPSFKEQHPVLASLGFDATPFTGNDELVQNVKQGAKDFVPTLKQGISELPKNREDIASALQDIQQKAAAPLEESMYKTVGPDKFTQPLTTDFDNPYSVTPGLPPGLIPELVKLSKQDNTVGRLLKSAGIQGLDVKSEQPNFISQLTSPQSLAQLASFAGPEGVAAKGAQRAFQLERILTGQEQAQRVMDAYKQGGVLPALSQGAQEAALDLPAFHEAAGEARDLANYNGRPMPQSPKLHPEDYHGPNTLLDQNVIDAIAQGQELSPEHLDAIVKGLQRQGTGLPQFPGQAENSQPYLETAVDKALRKTTETPLKSQADLVEEQLKDQPLAPVEPHVAQAAVDSIKKNGGVTIDTSGKQPKEGFVVANGQGPLIPLDEFGPDDINEFAAQNKADLRKPGAHIGGWVTGGDVQLDVSHVSDNLDDALAKGQANGQKTIWDLNKSQEIPVPAAEEGGSSLRTGDTGESSGLRSEDVSGDEGRGSATQGSRPRVQAEQGVQKSVSNRDLVSQSHPEAYQKALVKEAKHPGYYRRLVDRLNIGPKAIDDVDYAGIVDQVAQAHDEYDQAVKEQNANPGDPEAKRALEVARERVKKTYAAELNAGKGTGRGLNAHKMLEDLQYTAPAMEARLQAEGKGGKPISEKQRAEIERIAAVEERTKGIIEPEGKAYAGLDPEDLKKFKGVALAARSAEDYVRKSGIGQILPPTEAKVDVERARRIAQDYENLPKVDNSKATRDSYLAFGKEVDAQYKHAVDQGVQFDFTSKDPYKSSAEMMEDLRNNGTLRVYTGGEDHPYLGSSTKDADGLTTNDKFRAVHDLYGHASEGNQFGPQGEERAWRKHVAMFSDEAKPAMTAETRGQNSWVNYGPHMWNEYGWRGDKSNPDYLPPSERPFAEQKTALLGPESKAFAGLDPEDLKKLIAIQETKYNQANRDAVPFRFLRKEDGSLRMGPDGKPMPEMTPYDILNTPEALKAKEGIEGKEAQNKAVVKKLSSKLVQLYNKVKDVPEIAKAKGWYKEVRNTLRPFFDSDEDTWLFCQALGVTSAGQKPRANLEQAIDVFDGYKSGRFDDIIARATKLRDEGKLEYTDKFLRENNLLPLMSTKTAEGKYGQYGKNSKHVLRVLMGDWADNAPLKTGDYAGNFAAGRPLKAVIDMWAARTARRVMGGQRITPKGETAVTPVDYKITQDAFHEAAKKAGLDPDDMQAVLWFAEKHHWDKMGWGAMDAGDIRPLLPAMRKEGAGLKFDKEAIPYEHKYKYEQKAIDKAKGLEQAVRPTDQNVGRGSEVPSEAPGQIALFAGLPIDPERKLERDILRLRKETKAYDKKTAAKDTTPLRPKSEPVMSDEKFQAMQERDQARARFHQMVAEEQYKQEPLMKRAVAYLVEAARQTKLTGVVTAAKIALYTPYKLASVIAHDVAGLPGLVTPGMNKVMRYAPTEGLPTARGYSGLPKGMYAGLKKIPDVFKGKVELDELKQGGYRHNKGLIELPGRSHQAIKQPLKEGLTQMSFQKAMAAQARRGESGKVGGVEEALKQGREAGLRGILLNENWATKAYSAGVRTLPFAGQAVMKTLLPIVRVATNIPIETMRFGYGHPAAIAQRLTVAFSGGIKKASPELLDSIARNYKAGNVGIALGLIAYANRDAISSTYLPGEKKQDEDARFFGLKGNLAKIAMHMPGLHYMQAVATMGKLIDKGASTPEAALKAINAMLLDTPFLQLGKKITEIAGAKKPAAMVKKAVGETAGGMVPSILRDAAKAQDNGTKRYPQTLEDYIAQNVPYLRESVSASKPKPAHR